MSQLDDVTRLPRNLASASGSKGLGTRMMERLLRDIRFGRIHVILPSGMSIERTGAEPGPHVTVVVHRWRMLRRLLLSGDVGFAESYIDGDWTTPDLTALIRFAAINRAGLEERVKGSPAIGLFNRLRHMMNANTRRGSRRNIEAHYDLGNAFYSRWLDASMLYSSALYRHADDRLETAQANKLQRIVEKLALDNGGDVLEIGCGWGALALHLADAADARVTGITLSPSQLEWGRDAARRAGTADRVDLRLQDYRDTNGQFDRIVSIEMFEAVGEKYWPDYFAAIRRCLKPGGRAVLQIISISEDRFDSYRRKADFIQKYIFPGGFLPSDTALEKAVSRSGMKLVDVEHFGQSYARTLAEWRTRFDAHWPEIAALGFDDHFRRLWDYYLCYCEAGFEEGAINVGFYTLEHA